MSKKILLIKKSVTRINIEAVTTTQVVESPTPFVPSLVCKPLYEANKVMIPANTADFISPEA